jgi:inorganic pyrophosphatase
MKINKVVKEKNINQTQKDSQLNITVMIEIPKGSRNKYEYDHVNNRLRLDRTIYSSVQYPSDYGFVLDTLAQDGDPLDALVLIWEPTFPGCIIEVKPIGMLKMWDDKGIDEKIMCVPLHDPFWNHINKLSEIPPHLLTEIEYFFANYKTLEKKETGVDGWEDKKAALRIIKEAQERFVKNK